MISNQRVVALVPMKAHSERVANKNVRLFAGRPLYEHILETLEQTPAVDRVIVDTDSDTIAQNAPESFSKVAVLVRPVELRGDHMSMNNVIAHDVDQVPGDIYVQTHATNPLLSSDTIGAALERFVGSHEHDSLFSVNSYYSRFYHLDGRPINHDPQKLIRTQDLPPVFEENSCIFVFTKRSFAGAGNKRIGRRPLMFDMNRIESIDIDDECTFNLAEILAIHAHQTTR